MAQRKITGGSGPPSYGLFPARQGSLAALNYEPIYNNNKEYDEEYPEQPNCETKNPTKT
jgi:hypothetical protein